MIELHRRTARLAAASTAGVAVIAITGVAVAGAASSTGTGATRRAITSLVYTCRFPAGAQRTVVRVAAGLPVAGTVGQAVQLTGVHMTVTLPHGALGGLGRLGATTVRASASLGITVAEGRVSASTAWRGLTARQARLPATDSLALLFTGPVAPARPTAPGEVTFTADGLRLAISPHRAAISPRGASSTAASPATLTVACSPRPDQGRQLAAVPVSGPSPSAVGTGRHHSLAPSPAATSCFVKSPNPWIGSAFVAGYSNVRKLHEAALLGPGPNNRPRAGLSDLHLLYNLFDNCNQTLYGYSTGQLNYHGMPQLPPARSTFLNFGFVPVTATLTITLVPADCRDVTGHLIGKVGLCIVLKNQVSTQRSFTTVTSEQRFRVYDVAVNGVPLNVGPHCQTAVPTKVTLTSNAQYSVAEGGVLSGLVTIPPFTGCGVGEKLDPLLSSAISGPGNFVQLTQGPACLKYLPTGQVNPNCRIPPGPGHKYGVPKFYPEPVH